MKYFILGIVLSLCFASYAYAGLCRTIILPDGTVLVMCCDSRGNCTYN